MLEWLRTFLCRRAVVVCQTFKVTNHALVARATTLSAQRRVVWCRPCSGGTQCKRVEQCLLARLLTCRYAFRAIVKRVSTFVWLPRRCQQACVLLRACNETALPSRATCAQEQPARHNRARTRIAQRTFGLPYVACTVDFIRARLPSFTTCTSSKSSSMALSDVESHGNKMSNSLQRAGVPMVVRTIPSNEACKDVRTMEGDLPEHNARADVQHLAEQGFERVSRSNVVHSDADRRNRQTWCAGPREPAARCGRGD